MFTNYAHYSIADDEYEARIENAILRPDDLYDLDCETFFRNRNGCGKTFGREVGQ